MAIGAGFSGLPHTRHVARVEPQTRGSPKRHLGSPGSDDGISRICRQGDLWVVCICMCTATPIILRRRIQSNGYHPSKVAGAAAAWSYL